MLGTDRLSSLSSMAIVADNYNYFQYHSRIMANKYHLDIDDVMSHAMEFVCSYPYKSNKSDKLYYLKKMITYATKDLYNKLHPKVVINQESTSRFVDLDYEHPYTEQEFEVSVMTMSLKECLKRLLSTDFIAFVALKQTLKDGMDNPNMRVPKIGIDPELKKEIHECIINSNIHIETLLDMMEDIENSIAVAI